MTHGTRCQNTIHGLATVHSKDPPAIPMTHGTHCRNTIHGSAIVHSTQYKIMNLPRCVINQTASITSTFYNDWWWKIQAWSSNKMQQLLEQRWMPCAENEGGAELGCVREEHTRPRHCSFLILSHTALFNKTPVRQDQNVIPLFPDMQRSASQ